MGAGVRPPGVLPLGRGRLSRRDSPGLLIIISYRQRFAKLKNAIHVMRFPCPVFSFPTVFSFRSVDDFPLRLLQPRAVRRAVEPTRGLAVAFSHLGSCSFPMSMFATSGEKSLMMMSRVGGEDEVLWLTFTGRRTEVSKFRGIRTSVSCVVIGDTVLFEIRV